MLSFFRRAAVVAGLAAALAVSLVVTMPSGPASAAGATQTWAAGPPVINGSAPSVPDSAMEAGAESGPAGWGLAGVAALGMGLYSFMNTMMDWHPGQWGIPQNWSNGNSTGPTPSPRPSATGTVNGASCPGAPTYCGDLSQATSWDNYGTDVQNQHSDVWIGTQAVGPYDSSWPNGYALEYNGNPISCGASTSPCAGGQQPNGVWIRITSNTSNSNGFNVGEELRAYCKDNSSGAIRYTVNILTNYHFIATSNEFSSVAGNLCTSGEAMIGFYATPSRSAVMNIFGMSPGNWGTLGDTPNGTLKWGDVGSAPQTPPFDPKSSVAHYTTTVDCVKSDGTTFTASADWTGDQPGAIIPSCAAIDPSSHGKDVSITGTDPNTGVQTPLWHDTPSTTTSAPDCDPSRGTTSPCKLAVWVDGAECVIGAWQCVNWTQINSETASRVQCKFGPYVMATSDCNALERAYESQPVWGTQANTDGNPSTQSNTATSSSGQTQPQNPPSGLGTSVGGPATGLQADPSLNTDSGQNCFPSGWAAFNPLQWVFQPVGCALKWAFVSKTDLKTQTDAAVNKFKDKVPFVWFASAGALVVAGSSGMSAGCPNWTVHVGDYSWNVVCGNSFTQAILDNRLTIQEALTVAMLWPLIRALWYAAIPIFSVRPAS